MEAKILFRTTSDSTKNVTYLYAFSWYSDIIIFGLFLDDCHSTYWVTLIPASEKFAAFFEFFVVDNTEAGAWNLL